MRGLKQTGTAGATISGFAPHTGAWIETKTNPHDFNDFCSHPTRVRGLKQRGRITAVCLMFAPHTGAWIETSDIVNHAVA